MIHVLVFTLLAASVMLGAYSDARIDAINRRNHITEALSEVTMILGYIASILYISDMSLSSVMYILLTHILIRIGLFNLSYNKVRGLNYNYVGTTDNIFDTLINKLPNPIVVAIYIGCIFLSIVTLSLI